MTARASFKQSDAERLLKAAKNAGMPVVRIECEGGKIALVLVEGEPSRPRRNPLDRLHAA